MRYAYEVVAGTRNRPMGYVGTYGLKSEAEDNRPSRCASYIKRVAVEDDEWRPGRLWPRVDTAQEYTP